MFFSIILSGQTDRLVLIEEFTNASCQQCGVLNPDFDNLLLLNTDKLAGIKYRTNPGPQGRDPLYNDATTDVIDFVSDRASFYAINAEPTAIVQSTKAALQDFPNEVNAAVEKDFDINPNFCEYDTEVKAIVTNTSEVEITSLTAILVDAVSGMQLDQTDWTGIIAPGNTEEIPFTGFTEVTQGENQYAITIGLVNGNESDLNSLDDFTSTERTLKFNQDSVFDDEYIIDLEGTPLLGRPDSTCFLSANPAQLDGPIVTNKSFSSQIFDLVNQGNGTDFSTNSPIGGYGESNTAMVIMHTFWPATSGVDRT